MSKIKEPKDRIIAANAALQQPVQQKLIVYSTYNLTSKSDNVGRLLPEFVKSPLAEGFTHVVSVYSFNESFNRYRSEHQFPDNVRFVAFDSKEYITSLHTAKYLVSDGRLPTYYVRRSEQEHLNLFSHTSFLYTEEPELKYKNRMLTKLYKSAAMSTLITCENEQAAELIRKRLFLDDMFEGRLVRAALPELFPIEEQAADEPVEQAAASAASSGKKYTPEAIEALKAKILPAPEEEPEEDEPAEADFSAFIGSEYPDEAASAENIIKALLTGEGDFIPTRPSGRKKLLFVAYLAGQNVKMLALRNLIERIDTERYSVTVYSYRTSNTTLCLSFSENVRVVVRNDYIFNQGDIAEQLTALNGIDGSLEEKYLYQLDLARAVGCSDFDSILVYETANPYWHKLCAAQTAAHKTFAAVSAADVMAQSADPETLAALINNTYDKLLTVDEQSDRLDGSMMAKLPIAYSSCWKELRRSEEEFGTARFKFKRYLVLQKRTRPLSAVTIIPDPESWEGSFFCPVVSEEDAKAVAALFREYRKAHPEATLYLQILADSLSVFKDILAEGDGACLIVGEKLPLLLIKKCDCFVYPYTEDPGLCAAARLMGTRARRPEHPTLLKLALAGPTGGVLYSEYRPPMPEEPQLINDISIFSGTAMSDEELDGYESALALSANEDLFSSERQ